MSINRAIETHIEQHGGRAEILPPNKHQLHRTKSHASSASQSADDFGVVMDFSKNNPEIVKEIGSFPEPYVILATDQQIIDLQRTGMS